MKPNVITVLVTEEDMKCNDFVNNEGCPLFAALKRNGFPVKSVGFWGVELFCERFAGDDYHIFEFVELAGTAGITNNAMLIHLLKL